ncbi:MAG: TIGR02302 family protein [Hyphomicrobium sp.]
MAEPPVSPVDAAFARKVRASRITLYFERLWPRLWLILGVAGLFLLVSLLNVWAHLPQPAHIALLAGFAMAALAAVIYAARVNYPGREEAVRRLERASGIPHRPASSYEDTITANAEDPRTSAIWQAHRARLAAAMARLRVGPPHPRTDRADPVALRALLLLGVVAVASLVGDSAADRLRSAFRFNSLAALASARLDAWVTPPSYTTRPPVMLADGARGGTISSTPAKLIEVPERSVLIVRATGSGLGELSLEVLNEGATEKQHVAAKAPEAGKSSGTGSEISELRYELRKSAEVRVLASGAELARWPFYVIPDKAPKIALTKDPERTRRGALKLDYTVEDDYGVVSAEVKVRRPDPEKKAADPAKDWARPEPLKGARLPLEHPPTLTLRLPRGNTHAAQTYIDTAPHPYAGREVILTLEARDVAGNVGRSKPIRVVLPQRQFDKPLARALVEQRGKLLDDSRYRPQVLRALDALTTEPEGFIDNASIYLSLRTLLHGLERDGSRAGLKSATDGLWDIALRIEDGDLSDAEKALRDAQDKLAEALEKGAPDSEIQSLMQQLRDALSKYVEQLAKNNKDQNPPEGLDQDNQQLSQQDLERMMKELEDTAKNGSRDQAQQMLSQLRDLLERLQTGQMQKKDGERGQMMMKKLDELGNMIGQQQRLMDQTYSEHRKQAQRQLGGSPEKGHERQGGRQDQAGQNGEGGDQEQGQQGSSQRGKSGQQKGQGLGEQQRALREELEKLKKSLDEMGANSKELGNAEESMKNAEQGLNQGDTSSALGDQSQALDQMRQGAQKMAEDAQKNGQSRFGQNGETPRDPLGRPQRFQGPDAGNSVKVPDEIDMQRAREILEELRRRVAQPARPAMELDYFERLLRRF